MSITLLRFFCLIIFCLITVFGFRSFQNDRVVIKGQNCDKLIRRNDLIKYLLALNRLVDYNINHKNEIDINVYFGLFLTHVNLNRALREKHQVLPKKLHNYIKLIIRKTENLLHFFKETIDQDHELRNNKYKLMFTLFLNATTWIERLPKFSMILLNETTPTNLEKAKSNWILYRKSVDDRKAWLPDPDQSDTCLASLASAEEIQFETSRRCNVLGSCIEMLENGTDFGYALAHRLLFLQQARFGRGCSVFSEQRDKTLRRRFCSAAFQEADYIAWHDFEIVDLLLEHVCLCALEGHAQFLKRSWLTKILNFQTLHGCFSQNLYNSDKTLSSYSTVGNIAKLDHGITIKHCNGHTTAVAAGALALASRFILQFHY